jgi:hypothetical protein
MVIKIFIIPHPQEGFNYFWCCPRGEKIVVDGLRALSNIQLIDQPDNADFIFHTYVPHNKGQKNYDIISQYDPSKLVIIDWVDEPDYILYPHYFAYFKRSWCFASQENKSFVIKKYAIPRPTNMFPFWYCAMPEFIYQPPVEKTIDLGCYLRATCNNRKIVRNMFYNTLQNLPQTKFHLGEVTNNTRSKKEQTFFDMDYMKILKQTKIVVTCNPTDWEGDSRTWEALANNCLVFVDKMFVPYLHPLINGKHIIEYEFDKMEDFAIKLLYYRAHEKEAAEIAKCGCEFTLQHHTPKARMKYVIDVILQLKENNRAIH